MDLYRGDIAARETTVFAGGGCAGDAEAVFRGARHVCAAAGVRAGAASRATAAVDAGAGTEDGVELLGANAPHSGDPEVAAHAGQRHAAVPRPTVAFHSRGQGLHPSAWGDGSGGGQRGSVVLHSDQDADRASCGQQRAAQPGSG